MSDPSEISAVRIRLKGKNFPGSVRDFSSSSGSAIQVEHVVA